MQALKDAAEPRRSPRSATLGAAVAAAALTVAAVEAVTMLVDVAPALAERDSVTKDILADEKTEFFEGGLGRRMRHLCTGLAIVGGLVAVARAAGKGLFKGSGAGMAGGGGGAGKILKELVAPLIACALLLNLNWTFSGIEWFAAVGGDVIDEVQSWFDSTPI